MTGRVISLDDWKSSVFSDGLGKCIDPGVTERAPIPGVRYHGFIVHPRHPGPVTLAIAHRAGEDLCRDGLRVDDCAALLKRYRINEVIGADDECDGGTSLAHAALGALHLAGEAA